MLAETSFEVLAEFFPNFDTLDKFAALDAFARVPTYIISGTKDVLTSVGHSRKMASRIAGSTLVECAGAGHMVILEQKDKVNAALEELLVAAARGARARSRDAHPGHRHRRGDPGDSVAAGERCCGRATC